MLVFLDVYMRIYIFGCKTQALLHLMYDAGSGVSYTLDSHPLVMTFGS